MSFNQSKVLDDLQLLQLPRVLSLLDSCQRPVVNRHTCNLTEDSRGSQEINPLNLLDEGEDVAAGATPETVDQLLFRVDIEARSPLPMKRAEADKLGPSPSKLNVRADDRYQVNAARIVSILPGLAVRMLPKTW
jgi:hypothetical protein